MALLSPSPQVSYCPALSSLVCFCLRIGFLEAEAAAMAQASIDSCSRNLGVLSIGRATHVAYARGLFLAIKQYSSTAFELCTRIGLNFYRLANECNGRIFMHFLCDAALVEVFHAACCCNGADLVGKSEKFLYKFSLALIKFANRRGRLLSSSDNDSFFRNLAEYGRGLTDARSVEEVIRKAKSIKYAPARRLQPQPAATLTHRPLPTCRLFRRTLADYGTDRRELPLGDDVLPQPMDVVWLPCVDMTPPQLGNPPLVLLLAGIVATHPLAESDKDAFGQAVAPQNAAAAAAAAAAARDSVCLIGTGLGDMLMRK